MSQNVYDEYFLQGSIFSRELFNLVVGEAVGSGCFRVVHEFLGDKESVIKFETGGKSFENQMEWEVWKAVKDLPISKWFAPCLDISPCGCMLIQARVKPAELHQFPDKVPACFSDLKRPNWGMYKNRLVCVDYGANSSLILQDGIDKGRHLRKARWWDL